MIRLGGRCGTVSQGATAPDLSGAATVSLEVLYVTCFAMVGTFMLGAYNRFLYPWPTAMAR